MFKHSWLLRVLRGFACAALLALAGCATTPASHPPVIPARALPSASAGPDLVQSRPEYRQATAAYVRHDFRGALSLINTLSAQPPIRQDAAARAFVEQQARICRHALDPRVSLTAAQALPPQPALPRRADCGPRALLLVCHKAGVQASLPQLTREAGTTAQGTTLAGLARAARAHGFRAQGVQMNPQALSELSHPALAWVEADHYVAVLSVKGDQATIYDPNQPKEETISTTELWSRCGGVLLTLSR